jgi:hypothetical protein
MAETSALVRDFLVAKTAPRKLSSMNARLQHIACEPPGVFEDVLTSGARPTRVELTGRPATRLACFDRSWRWAAR